MQLQTTQPRASFIPPDCGRPPKNATPLWPFTYAIDPEVVRTTVEDAERALAVHRGTLAWALKERRWEMAQKMRVYIDQYQIIVRRGRAKLRELEQAAADAVLVEAALVVDRALAPCVGELKWAAE